MWYKHVKKHIIKKNVKKINIEKKAEGCEDNEQWLINITFTSLSEHSENKMLCSFCAIPSIIISIHIN